MHDATNVQRPISDRVEDQIAVDWKVPQAPAKITAFPAGLRMLGKGEYGLIQPFDYAVGGADTILGDRQPDPVLIQLRLG